VVVVFRFFELEVDEALVAACESWFGGLLWLLLGGWCSFSADFLVAEEGVTSETSSYCCCANYPWRV
jgi:hypothetical protein